MQIGIISKENETFKNVKIADFSEKMFEDIKIAIIKPVWHNTGMFKRGIAINSYLQKYNKEFLNNAKILKKTRKSVIIFLI